ncbi:hypothetical protein EYZ11_011593 [Aspergillus tanneri]|uniref:Uncharacterized protein n=1 Tax=Aspergillus tanneri TaxID=1220188 RepID=A0A4S3J2E6_9EURO|nr:hypothetical protein EYZ11_011593 [Aspergillus tanneri]
MRLPDILTKFLNIYHERGHQIDFDPGDVKLEAYGAFFAGSDTTPIAITAETQNDIEESPRQEIELATVDSHLSIPHISYDETVKLHYLSDCVKEGIRMCPSIGLILPRNVPDKCCEVAEHWVTGKARIGVNPAVVHLGRSVFGEDALEYRPDRWFRPGAQDMDRYLFQSA